MEAIVGRPKPRYRVLLTGSRTWDMPHIIHAELNRLRATAEAQGFEFVLVHGGCPKGADMMAHQWAVNNGSVMEIYPADWGRHGRRAGHIRNSAMIDSRPAEVIGFLRGDSSGTSGCLREARSRGLAVTQIDYDLIEVDQ